jgi:hypothetical protein
MAAPVPYYSGFNAPPLQPQQLLTQSFDSNLNSTRVGGTTGEGEETDEDMMSESDDDRSVAVAGTTRGGGGGGEGEMRMREEETEDEGYQRPTATSRPTQLDEDSYDSAESDEPVVAKKQKKGTMGGGRKKIELPEELDADLYGLRRSGRAGLAAANKRGNDSNDDDEEEEEDSEENNYDDEDDGSSRGGSRKRSKGKGKAKVKSQCLFPLSA